MMKNLNFKDELRIVSGIYSTAASKQFDFKAKHVIREREREEERSNNRTEKESSPAEG